MSWRVPYSSPTRTAHLMRTDGAGHARMLCSGAYTNSALAEFDVKAPRCKRCEKAADAADRKLALQESWSLPILRQAGSGVETPASGAAVKSAVVRASSAAVTRSSFFRADVEVHGEGVICQAFLKSRLT
jgi:hypothetical protein